MDRFFKNVQRMNSLLPLFALLVVFGALIWDSFKNHENRQAARWLFKDQTQRIRHVKKLPETEGAFAKAIYIEAAPISKMYSPKADYLQAGTEYGIDKAVYESKKIS